jgi:hypothetical protein
VSVSRETLAGLLRANVVNMSYNITVTAAGGELTVTQSGDVPDGEHSISGHDDATYVSVGVDRRDVDGKQILNANAAKTKGV